MAPASDFYKKLALELSSQQIAVDLFTFSPSSQLLDLTTLCQHHTHTSHTHHPLSAPHSHNTHTPPSVSTTLTHSTHTTLCQHHTHTTHTALSVSTTLTSHTHHPLSAPHTHNTHSTHTLKSLLHHKHGLMCNPIVFLIVIVCSIYMSV